MNERRKNIFSLLALVLVLIVLVGFVIPTYSQVKNKPVDKEKKYLKYGLFVHAIDSNPEQTRLKALEEYKKYPPLRPERFRRRVKRLWGIDINDYSDNAIIDVGGHYGGYVITLSKNYQLIDGFVTHDDENDLSTYIDHERSVYPYVRAYAFINDPEAKEYLLSYTKKMKDKYFGGHQVQWIDPNSTDGDQGVEGADFFVMLYYSGIFCNNQDWMKYNINLNSPMGVFAIIYRRSSDLRLDMLSQFLKKELAKGRKFKNQPFYGVKNDLWIGFNPNDSVSSVPYPFAAICHYPTVTTDPNPTPMQEKEAEYSYRPWNNYSSEKGVSSFLNFVLQLQNKYMNSFVIRFMSGQIDKYIPINMLNGSLQKNIKSNNYYGYSVLREFCENPMREMPTLDKIGTNFKAKVNKSNSLLLLEPFADSYDIDTIQPNEIFKAYEMGHDDYYFIEIEKPVESPVAGKDGYAMILDRKETVYGYLPKLMVKKYTSQEVLSESRYTDKTKSKQGVIEDKDGFVNIRKEANAQSEVVGKILDKEKFQYWETSDNWYIVETNSGLRGYVFKDRIREKYDTGDWTIDE